MAGKIFYRQRRNVGEKEKKPRHKVVAHSGVDIHFIAEHFRMQELEQIAKAVDAELVELTVDKSRHKD
jgi:hypothetical protein